MKNRTILTVFLMFILSACASQKGYEGESLSADETAVIHNSEKTKFEDGKVISLIEYVDAIHVGDAFRGWPSKVRVKPGEVTLRLGFRELSFGKSLTQGILSMGGAVGGLAAGSLNDDGEPYYELKASVEKGENYVIVISSPSNSVEDLRVTLESKGS